MREVELVGVREGGWQAGRYSPAGSRQNWRQRATNMEKEKSQPGLAHATMSFHVPSQQQQCSWRYHVAGVQPVLPAADALKKMSVTANQGKKISRYAKVQKDKEKLFCPEDIEVLFACYENHTQETKHTNVPPHMSEKASQCLSTPMFTMLKPTESGGSGVWAKGVVCGGKVWGRTRQSRKCHVRVRVLQGKWKAAEGGR